MVIFDLRFHYFRSFLTSDSVDVFALFLRPQHEIRSGETVKFANHTDGTSGIAVKTEHSTLFARAL